MQDRFEACAALVREADRDRYFATLFAPSDRRNALFALYAFNVEIARVRDLAREPMPGEIRLQWWREALGGERSGEAAAHPVAAALLEIMARYDIASNRLVAMIDARAFDLYDDPMATVTDLEIYAIETQSALFSVAARILGADGAANESLTLDAGIAYTIAGVLSSLGRHASRRQLYLPLDVLNRHHIDRDDIFAGQDSEALRAALADMRALARRHLTPAKANFKCAPQSLLPALLPVALVGPGLRRMERAGYQPYRFEHMSLLRRQWLLWRAARDPDRIFRA